MRKTTLGDLVTFRTGKLNSNAAVATGQYPFFTCSQETYRIDSYSFDTECVLLAGNNAAGVYPLKYYKGKFDAYQRTYVIESRDHKMLLTRFLYYLLRPQLERLQALSTGAATKFLTLSILKNVEVSLPDVDAQRRIASILSAYDDLIENNTRRIAILEEMARRIYEEWFVRFRFPGHEQVKMVESELGLIPEGWTVQRLDEAAVVTMGQSPSSEHYNLEGKGLPFHQGVTDFGAHYPSHRTYCTVDGRMAEEGDILMSVRAPVGRINLAPSDMVIGRGLCAIRSRTGRQWFLLHRLIEKFEEEDCMGNGAIFKAVTKQDVLGILFPQAPDALEAGFERITAPLWQLIRNLTLKNANLRATRDLLLPKLISGELDVSTLPEPEEAIAA